MLLTVITKESIHTSSLPEEVSGMHWIKSAPASGSRKLGFIEAKEGAWVLSPKTGTTLVDRSNASINKAILDLTQESIFSFSSSEGEGTLIARPACSGDTHYQIVGYPQDEVLTFGRTEDNVYRYPSPFVSTHHARIDFVRDAFTLTDLGSEYGTFVNGWRIDPQKSQPLYAGDVIEIVGLTMCVGKRFFSMNNPSDSLFVGRDDFVYYITPPYNAPEDTVEEADEREYFSPAPRFKRDIDRKEFTVDAPPTPEKPDETPIAMKIGPSMLMGFAALFMGVMMFSSVLESGGSLMRALPRLVMALSMLLGAVLWPILNRRYQNKKAEHSEAKRKATYAAYLDKVRLLIQAEIALQKEILEENRIPVTECAARVFTQDAHVMDRTQAHDDFLELRLGTGTLPLSADIRYPDEHFTVEEDALANVVYALSKEPTDIVGAPVSVNLVASQVIGIAGPPSVAAEFTYGLITQITCLHTYEDVKIVLLCDETQVKEWQWVCSLPHSMDDMKIARFVATNVEEAQEIGLGFERLVEERASLPPQQQQDIIPHFVIICASKKMADKVGFIGNIASKRPQGFSLITLADTPKALPKQCTSIIEVSKTVASIRDKADITGTALSFKPDIFVSEKDGGKVALALNMIELDLTEARGALPESLGFMEMFEAGNVEQLNVRTRWAEAKASNTLSTPVGVDANKEPFMLNLHEKFHGPHGLIAGTTGSGKSEFIITWILSMCVNFSPEEAAFVLIDYKGGGLAGAFDNDRVRLPHLAGTITNLDGAAINRSLVSIKSELKRRQALFNEAREVAGGDNVDIYKYLELFHAGHVTDPCPHLFIVADEFAELKAQEPEFMDELISAARIGRSLGVHLVLATQKPSGVVNDQIWSNSKFKVCLKVADKADSKEMIKRADAAEITQAGRFFLLVGYNEYFASGQSAYTGTPYIALDQYITPKDDSVVLVSPTGRALLSAKAEGPVQHTKPSPELVAILSHIEAVAQSEDLFANTLWLDPIPAHITVDELRAKYPCTPSDPFTLNPIIGELDDPENQAQHLLTLPLSEEGNAVIYGSAGSGTDTVVSTILYSLISDHTPEELAVYIMDFGAETLRVFKDAPQVGGICTLDEEEKVTRLFNFLEKEVKRRSRILGAYGGGYVRYAQEQGGMPSIVVVINEIAPFVDVFGTGFEQRLISLTRECIRCGVRFLITASAPNDIRMRLRQNLSSSLSLSLNDVSDYVTIFGSMRGTVPPTTYCRGLIKQGESLYEFQAAQVSSEDEDDFTFIKEFCDDLSQKIDNVAAAIPSLPKTVTPDVLIPYVRDLSAVPVGISCTTLEPVFLNMQESLITRIGAKVLADTVPVIQGIIEILVSGGTEVIALDASNKLDDVSEECACIKEPDQAIQKFISLAQQRVSSSSKVTPVVCIVFDIGNLMNGFPGSADLAVALNTTMPTQSAQDGVHYLFVSTGVQAKEYMTRTYCAQQVSKDDGLWVGDNLKNFTQVFDPGFSNVAKLPKAKKDEGFCIVGQEPQYTKYVHNGKDN